MENNELKPCPFCGGKARLYDELANISHGACIKRYYVVCDTCYASGGEANDFNAKNGDYESLAIELWNRRANDENNI